MITLSMIVKNEEQNIGHCLESVRGLIDEAIIVDTGSTDNTVDLVRHYDDKVIIRQIPWNNDFAAARNESLRGATGEWILVLDADEELVFAREALIAYLAATEFDAVCIPTYNVIEVGNIQYTSGCLRLLRNKGFQYTGVIHEQLTGTENIGILGEALAKILHYGYSPDAIRKKDKRNRNKTIIAKALGNNPKDPLLGYHLGMEHMAEGDYAEALHLFTTGAGGIDGSLPFRQHLSHQIALCFYNLRQYDECIHYIEELAKDPKMLNATFYFILGNCYQELNQEEAALAAFRKCLQLGKAYNFSGTFGFDSFYPQLSMARIKAKQGEVMAAARFYVEGVFDKENVHHIGKDEAREYLAKNSLVELLKEFDKIAGCLQ